jgi:hypothetical protein
MALIDVMGIGIGATIAAGFGLYLLYVWSHPDQS